MPLPSGLPLVAVAVGVVLGLALSACGTAAPARDPDAGVVSLRMATLTDESTLQPYSYVNGYPGWALLTLVYDTLSILDADNEPRPWLATGDTTSADGLVHTITLRGDVTWHDGRALTSADVAFTFGYYQTHTHGRWTPAVRDIARIETPDATTVVVELRAPDPSFARRLMADVPIIPQHVWHDVTAPKAFAGRIGSGLFRLTEYRPGQSYRLSANREHFSGPPNVDELLIPIVNDPATVFAALEAGEIHATTLELAPELVARFRARAGLEVVGGPGYSTTVLQFNTTRPPWNQTVVRQAVALAIDTRLLVDTLLLGFGTPGSPGWFHPGSPHHDPAVTSQADPSRARTMLDRAGYVDGDRDGVREAGGVPMAPVLLVQANNPTRVRAAELIAAAVKAIGIDARVRAQEAGSVTGTVWPDLDVTRGRDYDWTMFGWAAPQLVDPLRVVSLVDSDVRYGTNNIGGYESPEADALAARLRGTLDLTVQRDLLRQLERVIARDRPFVTLWYPDLTYAYDPAAYDGWVFQQGQGLFNRLSFVRGGTR